MNAVIEGTASVVSVVSPSVSELVDALPTMQNGKPRRFLRYCECFEWTFTQVQRKARRLNNHFVDRDHLTSHVDRLAGALWHHQNPRAA